MNVDGGCDAWREIAALVAGYGTAFDQRDAGRLRRLWLDDATLDLGRAGRFDGPDAIVREAERQWAGSAAMHHLCATPEITLGGAEGRASTAVRALIVGLDGTATEIAGRYHDRFADRGGGWGILHREFDLVAVLRGGTWVAVRRAIPIAAGS